MRTRKAVITVRPGAVLGKDFENNRIGDKIGFPCLVVLVSFWS